MAINSVSFARINISLEFVQIGKILYSSLIEFNWSMVLHHVLIVQVINTFMFKAFP